MPAIVLNRSRDLPQDGGRLESLRWTAIEVSEGWIGLAADDQGLRASTIPHPTFSQAREDLANTLATGGHPLEGKPAATLMPHWEDALRAYFVGRRVDFYGAPLDWQGATRFQQAVWSACRRIGYGQTCTYGELAARLGRPESARAVGQALGANPLPLIVPCHRVVGVGRQLRGFSGGLHWKSWLLEWEEMFV